jgi:gamma-glutamylcyclotransferase (GGCT)/AIG2-like uncharacterized protein YtfP
MPQYLFVYGTLRKGFEPPSIAETAEKLKFVSEGFVYGNLYDLGPYTTVILGGEGKVFGQILELPEDWETLQKLDEYEGFEPNNIENSLFVRKLTAARIPDGKIECWVYEYNRNLSSDYLIAAQDKSENQMS